MIIPIIYGFSRGPYTYTPKCRQCGCEWPTRSKSKAYLLSLLDHCNDEHPVLTTAAMLISGMVVACIALFVVVGWLAGGYPTLWESTKHMAGVVHGLAGSIW